MPIVSQAGLSGQTDPENTEWQDSMKREHLQPLTPAAIYARVSSGRQDVYLSVAAQLQAVKDYARGNVKSIASGATPGT